MRVKSGIRRVAAVAVALGLVSGGMTASASGKSVTKAGTFNQCVSVNSQLTDHSTTSGSVFINVPKNGKKLQSGTVTGFSIVGTRITHTFGGDLTLTLVSPAGKAVALAIQRGDGAEDGYGSGAASCTGSLLQFGDSFGAPIASAIGTGDDPLTGQFRPEQPLSSLVGGPVRGFWTLVVEDCCTDDVGSLNAFSLSFTYSFKKPARKKGGR
jgi:subtilisin-like proprotein convertase family protein